MQFLRGLIAGGVRNPVFANVLMILILACGYFSTRRMVRESYPEFSLDHIAIEVAYPGASAEDVERAICIPVEEALRGMEGVRKISSSANENFGTVWAGLLSSVNDTQAILNEVKDRVDQITDWPKEVEKPVIHETSIRTPVINVAIYGDVPERTLKQLAREVENDLVTNRQISQISLSGIRDDEITIEVSEHALTAYNLSLEKVMAVVAQSSLDLPAGLIRTAEEEVTLRIMGQRYRAADYEKLVILESGNTIVYLGDIATIREGFEDAVVRGQFNGESAVVVQVYKTAEEDATKIARIVRNYVAGRQPSLPDRLQMSVWADGSQEIDARISMLIENGAMGILLVLITLALFLELRVALWVVIGIPVSFAGALVIMYITGETLNLISLFALIMVSGIIVDDAIVIADSIQTQCRKGLNPQEASIEGAQRVALPVLGASLTTIAAFIPLLYVVGVMGRFIYVLPVVIIAAICASAIEAFVILPAHLSHRSKNNKTDKPGRFKLLRHSLDEWIDRFIVQKYRPIYRKALEARIVTLAIAVASLLVVVGMIIGGRTPLVVFPQEDSNLLQARVRFPEGTPYRVAQQAIQQLEKAALALNHDSELQPASPGPIVKQVYSLAGEFANFLPVRGNNLCETQIELMPAQHRRIHDDRIMDRWRHHIGTMYDAIEFRIARKKVGPTDRPLEIRILGDNLVDMSKASQRIQEKLWEFEGVTDVSDDLIPGKRELRISLKTSARSLGLTLEDVAKQIRHGFFGGEAVRLYRGRDQVKVRVRYPDNERRSISQLENLRIATPRGNEIPFLEVADIKWDRGYANIMHQDNKRRVRVVADIDDRLTNAEQIMSTLQAGFLDQVIGDYNHLSWEFGGDRERMDESLSSLWDGFELALIAIYAVLATMLRSYVQPIVILAAVPFGLIGAVFGHAILGLDLTLMSLFGVVALSGVVVNDSLVLVDAINRGISEGKSVRDAVHAAGELRFRAVVLTSITTVAGLAPLLLERSTQAQSVIPMAVSLTFGLMFATVLTLFVVPALFLIVNDIRRAIYWLRFGGAYPQPEIVEEAAQKKTVAAH